jgi:L-lactate dehydrogenase complex protein LldG
MSSNSGAAIMQNSRITTDINMAESDARSEILTKLRNATHPLETSIFDRPSWRTPARESGSRQEELDKMLAEIKMLGGGTRQLGGPLDLKAALGSLVAARSIKRATSWENPLMEELRIEASLRELGVEMVSPHADKHLLSECDLGVTGADCALPESGTLFLCSSRQQPFVVSLLPRIHLVILDPKILREDIAQAFDEFKGKRFVCVTGPSRTADIELTLSIGVHGPKELEVWAINGS